MFEKKNPENISPDISEQPSPRSDFATPSPALLPRIIIILTLVVMFLSAKSQVRACASAPSHGHHVDITDESAVIVWDANNHIEHFIRRAAFHGDTNDFGFLVPTPEKPLLSPAEDDVFTFIAEQAEPKIIYVSQTGIRWISLFNPLSKLETAGFTASMKSAPAPLVRVIDTQQVSGYDAVVLEADNPAALNDWLQSHGYASRPALTEWLAPYVAMHWKITAFKIASSDKGIEQLAVKPVRMSFKTDRPFYPYREPSDQSMLNDRSISHDRRLSVFFISTERVHGTFEQGDNQNEWSVYTPFSSVLEEEKRKRIAEGVALKPEQLPSRLWITIFEDSSSTRQGKGDIFFVRSPSQAEKIPPPIYHEIDHRTSVPIELALMLLIVSCGIGVYILRRLRKQRPLLRE